MKLPVLFPFVMVLLSACASFGTFASLEGNDVQFASDAEENMRKGDEAMESKNYAEAAAYFEFVKTKYPFLELAKTAELRLADADFEREHFVEARDRYQNFVRLHPTHARIDYAAYQGALTHYKEIPADFFVLPPSTEKDQVEVRNALSAMNEFTLNYPKSELGPEAKKIIGEVKLRLAEHELYVASFYARRDRWPAVVTRLKVVLNKFSGIGLDEQVSFDLSEAYLKLSQPANAREVLQQYATQFPDTEGAKRAHKLMAKIEVPAPPSAPVPIPDGGT